jgi:hypothetical protein
LFFVLSIALRFSGVRLYLLLPAVFIAAMLTSLRILHLRTGGKWQFPWSLGMGLVCVQLAAGFHYWPLTPIQFGLALIGPLFGLIYFATNLGENIPMRRALLEPLIIIGLSWGLALFIR